MESKSGRTWWWPILVVLFILISIIEVVALSEKEASGFERIFWIISLAFWSLAGIFLVIGKIKQKKSKK